MSMPQSGPPDPYAQAPVTGGPQSPYDPQGGPPPYQQTPPPPPQQPGPPSFNRPPTTAKPQALMLGGIGSGVIALMFLIQAVMQFLNVSMDSAGAQVASSALYGVFPLLMALGAGAGAMLSFMGTDFGRVFVAAVGGAAIWHAAGWWRELLAMVLGHFGAEHMPWVSAIAGILAGFAGLGVVFVAANPALSTYFAEKSGKPAGGGPMGQAPSGQQPGGPGMAPPPGQQPGQIYGQPPAGQPQQGQPYGGQQQPGQPYGGQPQPGQTYGGQQQPGQTYGEQPPGGPGAPPPPG